MAILEGRFLDGLFGYFFLPFFEVEVIELFEACQVVIHFINQEVKLPFLWGNSHI
jgi:hypothetical protein